jgi:hypothetical protein
MARGEHVPAATTAAIHRCGTPERVPVLIDDPAAYSSCVSPASLNCAEPRTAITAG